MASKKGGKVEAPVAEAPKEPEIVTGQGQFTLPDSSEYDGEWKEVNGKKVRDGQGRFSLGLESYTGSWVSDRMEGKGQYSFGSGAVYNGEFKGGLMHGEGEYTFPDGAVYRGSWTANKMHGSGVYTDKDQNVFSGRFINGLYDSGKAFISLRSSIIK